MRSLHLNRHELYHAAALFRIAVLGFCIMGPIKLDDGWPESEKRIFQAALSMVVVKNSR